ncbi:hypothetical protein [Trebonia sp.]|uniref:hypothetical protein n=1 Tax=Trebonia sp. TaxID=2767075 RepID=UPI003BAE9CCF
MALFMDHHEDLKLPAEVLAQIAEDTRRCHRSGEAPGPAAVPPRYRVGHRATPPHTAPRTLTVGSSLTSGRLARH